MDGGEAFVLMVSLLVATIGWGKLILDALLVSPLMSSRARRAWLAAGPVLGNALVVVTLRRLASFDVRSDLVYLFFYAVLGLAWMPLAAWHGLGISARDDVIERSNAAALVAWNGAIVGCAACYAGANIGDGPGWWCVLWAAGLATAGWMATWVLLHALTRIADHVTIDRDLASGMRAASFLIASGVLWGRGAAGDWTSAAATVLELRAAWPVAILLVKAILIERIARPRPDKPLGSMFSHGFAPALLDAAIVALGLHLAGPIPDGYPIPETP
jgi:hypothetical protein